MNKEFAIVKIYNDEKVWNNKKETILSLYKKYTIKTIINTFTNKYKQWQHRDKK